MNPVIRCPSKSKIWSCPLHSGHLPHHSVSTVRSSLNLFYGQVSAVGALAKPHVLPGALSSIRCHTVARTAGFHYRAHVPLAKMRPHLRLYKYAEQLHHRRLRLSRRALSNADCVKMAAWMKPSVDMDKLRYEIFSILETKFLFGCDDAKLVPISGTSPETPSKPSGSSGKVRILSIDGGGASDGLFAAVSLMRLETYLRRLSGDPSARIADFFDLAAGSGPGGVLAALLFSRGPDGRPLFSAEEALEFLSENQSKISNASKKGIFGKRSGIFGRIFGDRTVREALKPMLIPCHDLETGAGMMFSRADAVEMDGYDFFMRDVCAATCAGDEAVGMRSVDGRSKISAVGAGVENPTAAAITHVLNNRQEFPRANGVEDLLVLSLGGGRRASPPSKAKLARIAADGAADMVDQAVAMAFGHNRAMNYVRVEANGLKTGKTRAAKVVAAEAALTERNVELVLFRGSKLLEQTNAERLELFAGELIREQERRKWNTEPTVLIK